MSTTLVRNLMPGPTVLTPDPKSQEFIQWAPAGDPDGLDVQIVSEEAVNTVPFMRAVAQQVLEIKGDAPQQSEAVMAHMARQVAASNAARKKSEEQVAAVVTPEADKDLLGIACIGPDTRGAGTSCGELVSIPNKERNSRVPLCKRHQHLKSQYVAEETIDTVDGKPKTVTNWSRVTLGAREREISS